MKTSLLTYLFRRYPLEKAFQVCSDLGYDGIEIWGARPHAYPWDMDGEKIEDILRMKEQYGLEITSEPDEGTTVRIHLPAVRYEEVKT